MGPVGGYQWPPSFRLLLAMMVGIVCGDAFPEHVVAGTVATACVFVLMFVAYRRWGRWISVCGLAVCLTFAGIGYVATAGQRSAVAYDFTNQPAFYRFSVCDVPEDKPRTLMCRVRLKAEWRGERAFLRSDDKQFLLYVAKDSAALTLRRGDELLVHTRLSPPANRCLPDAFDYARFLARRGVSGTAYVPAGHWTVVGRVDGRTFVQRAADMRAEVVGLFRRLGFRGDELAILSALTVGDKEELSEEITETYSVVGASHILALSGMHIGLIYALLWLLTKPLWSHWGRLKPVVQLGIMALLWGFAFLTGLSASVVRAVVMCSLFILVSLRSEHPLTLDTLTAAALLMLLYNPSWLFDVGFQLSFLAVAALVLIHPGLYALCPFRSSWLRKVWALMSMSVAAQLGTAPLVMHYFSRFSTHFLLTNLWVVPVSTLVVYAAVVLLVLTPLPAVQLWFAPVVDWLIRMQNTVLRWIEQLPLASIDGIWLGVGGTCLLYAVIWQANRAWRLRTARSLCWSLGLLLLFVGGRTCWAIVHAPSPGVAFYSVRGCPAVHCLGDGSQSWLVHTDSLPDVSGLCRTLSPHWNHLQLAVPRVVGGQYQAPGLLLDNQMLTYRGRQICLLSDNRWRHKTVARPLHLDYLFVAKGYRGGIAELMSLFDVGQVILDANLSRYYRQRVQDDCNRLNIPCRLLENDAMLRIDFD